MSSEPTSTARRLLTSAFAVFAIGAAGAMAQETPMDYYPIDKPVGVPMEPPVDIPVETPVEPPVDVPITPAPHSSSPSIHESLPSVIPSFGVERSILNESQSIFGVDRSDRVLPLDATLAMTIATAIGATEPFCESLPEAYQVDCIAERLDWIATTLPAGRENDEIRRVLGNASRQIEQVARQNRDGSQPRIRAKTPGANPVSTSRPLIAVKPEAQAAAVAETAAILEEASALLLRSSARSQEHAEQYRTIAEALDSSALLLRS